MSELKEYERTSEEFADIFNYCKVYRIRHVEKCGKIVHASRLYLLKDKVTLRTMATVQRHKITGLAKGFSIQPNDMFYVSDDGVTSILRSKGAIK